MLLLDSRTLWRGWGDPGASAGQEMGAGALARTKPLRGFSVCLPRPPSPAPAGSLPLLTISHAQCPLAGSAWHGVTSEPPPCLRTSPSCSGCPCHPGRPWARTLRWDLAAAPAGPAGILATNLCPCPVPSPRGPAPALCPVWVLPQLAPGPQGGISLIFLNKRKYYLSLRARISFPAPCMLWKASPRVTARSPLRGHGAVIHQVLAGLLLGVRRPQDLPAPPQQQPACGWGRGYPVLG